MIKGNVCCVCVLFLGVLLSGCYCDKGGVAGCNIEVTYIFSSSFSSYIVWENENESGESHQDGKS